MRRSPGALVNGLLENGYFKLGALAVAIATYLWQGASWKAQVEGQFHMLSYQITALDRRFVEQSQVIENRIAAVEHAAQACHEKPDARRRRP
jgi:hypothetical protein